MRKKKTVFIVPLIVIVVVLFAIVNKQKSTDYHTDSGMIFGTTYNITYQSDKQYKEDIVKVLNGVDASLSMFNPQSVIAKVNNNEEVTLDDNFMRVFAIAEQVNRETNGAFDITVAPLVNAWGFGFKNGQQPSDKQVDSLKQIIGMEKVSIRNSVVRKTDSRIMLDCSAVAKGYGVDVVANLLTEKGVKNFMVEIGGEIVTKGVNSKRLPWRIGVVKPTFYTLSVGTELQTTLNVTDKAMATSGNYRNFYYKGGKKYAHTINPKTGYPVQHNILSATVLAPDCATADAYATSFMVMGLEGARQVLKNHKELMAYLIYSDEEGKMQVWFSPGLNDATE